MKHRLPLFILVFLFSFRINAQSPDDGDTTTFYELSLEQLMDVSVTVATPLPMAQRESPAIITVITADEILKTGAQDLMQVLKQVPGFDFGVDVEGVIGLGVRGNWAHEGKALLLLDGMEMNEDLYATLQFGHHYPIDRIKRIEIIRGPGSAKYGGTAEYAVINVITNNNAEFNGIAASVSNSWMSQTFGARNASVAYGKTFGQSHINVSTHWCDANQSQKTYTDYNGSKYDMANQSAINNSDYRVDLFVRHFSLTGTYNRYSVQQRDGFDAIFSRPYNVEFNSANVSAKYDILGKNGLTVTPGIKLKYQLPWKYAGQVENFEFAPFNTSVNKKEYYINSAYDITNNINLSAGVQYYNQHAEDLIDSSYFSDGKKSFSLDNYAAYLQSTIQIKTINIIMGCRYNFNPYYGSSIVPRFGITKVREKYHFKVLYSNAFRAPSVENINIGENIQPENTSVMELESGFKITKNDYLTANIFHIKTNNPIVYGYDENANEYYINDSCAGTDGFEIDYKWKVSKFFASINYSYYRVPENCRKSTSVYTIPGVSNQTLAFPTHKINFNINISLTKKIDFNFTESFLSDRYSSSTNDLGIATITHYHPVYYSNAAINIVNLLTTNLNFQISCLNILDENIYYIQPYKGNHEPLPGTSREIQIRMSYSF